FRDGSATLGTARLVNGVATFQTSSLSAGSHSLTALWFGDSNYVGSNSPAVPLTVNAPAVVVASGVSPALNSQAAITLAARGDGSPRSMPAFLSALAWRLGIERLPLPSGNASPAGGVAASEAAVHAALQTLDHAHAGEALEADWIADLLRARGSA